MYRTGVAPIVRTRPVFAGDALRNSVAVEVARDRDREPEVCRGLRAVDSPQHGAASTRDEENRARVCAGRGWTLVGARDDLADAVPVEVRARGDREAEFGVRRYAVDAVQDGLRLDTDPAEDGGEDNADEGQSRHFVVSLKVSPTRR